MNRTKSNMNSTVRTINARSPGRAGSPTSRTGRKSAVSNADSNSIVGPSAATIKILHQNCQKEVELAIKSANNDGNLDLDFIEFAETLQNLGYTP